MGWKVCLSMKKGNAVLILKDKGVGVRETCRKLGIGCATYYSVIRS